MIAVIRRRSIAFIAFFFATLAFGAEKAAAQSREDAAKEVYSTAFDVLFHADGESPSFLVLGDSLPWRPAGVAYDGKLLVPYKSKIDRHTIADFISRTGHSVSAVGAFSYSVPTVLLSVPDKQKLDSLGREITASTPANDLRADYFWYGLLDKYPGTWGLTVFSQVGFNRDRTEALVYLRHGCGSCGHAETMFLRRDRGVWRVAERIPNEVRETPGFRQLRYLGPDAHFLADRRRVEDSTRTAIADSITRDGLPRRIHGLAVNRTTNVPIPHAQVFLQHHPIADNPEELKASKILLRTLADSLGRFEFLNPPIGITTLILECPGHEFSESIGLDMEVALTAQGGNKGVDLVAPNIGPCWKSHRYFPIQPGWLESAEARTAIAPTREESDVMATVISRERSNRNGSRIVAIRSHTITRCRFNRRCGSLQFDRMVHDHGIDSLTIVAFKNRTSKSEVLNPAFARRVGLQVMTRDEMHYLATSALRASPQSTPAEDSARFWPGFRQLHGSGSGIISISSVGFNRARSEALVEVRVDSTGPQWSDYSRMMLLRESGKKWRVVNDNVGGAGVQATSGNWEHGRCVAVRSPQTISRAAVNSLLGEFDLTLVDAGEGRKTTMRVRIERNLPPRWSPGPSSTSKPLAPLPRSYEVIAAGGGADISKTEDLSITWIPRNIIRDPMLIRLDGFYQNLKISKVTNSGFYGSYVDGVFGDSGFGYFCAQRVAQH